jgi:septum formation protein
VQGRAATFIERIDGSYTNVVGLPLCEVVVALKALSWM